MIKKLSVQTRGQGLVEITNRVDDIVRESGITEGLCTLFIQHTSASLISQENADPSARDDLENWLCSLVPESDDFTHRLEGSDDMPAHVKSMLTATSLSIPILHGQLALGTWQGIFVWEHKIASHNRTVLIHIA